VNAREEAEWLKNRVRNWRGGGKKKNSAKQKQPNNERVNKRIESILNTLNIQSRYFPNEMPRFDQIFAVISTATEQNEYEYPYTIHGVQAQVYVQYNIPVP
jgi:hypothetical protein